MTIAPKSADRPNVPGGGPSDLGKLISIAGTGIVIAIIGVGAFLLLIEVKDRQAPDLAAMRQYRINHLTDEQIRKMHADAELEFQKIRRDAAEEGKAFWRQYSQECARAQNDVAYRVHHPDECRLPLTWQSIGTPLDQRSVQQILNPIYLEAVI